MAVAVDATKIATFEAVFQSPSIDRMLAMEPDEFEQFIGYVFTCAGYDVERVADQKFPFGPGFDLNLHAGRSGGRPIARIEVKRYAPDNVVDTSTLMEFVGKLQVGGGIPGYFVTTSDFNRGARAAAAQTRARAFLINGRRLLRYIAYVGGSRAAGEYAGAPVGPAEPIDPAMLALGEDVSSRIARQPAKARVLAIANNKGGVAKTTTALNLGFALAEQYQQRVLLVDMDGQASLTRSLPRPLQKGSPKDAAPPPDETYLTHYFRGQAQLRDLVRPTRFATLSLIPAHADLLRLDTGSSGRPKAEVQFIADLHQLAIDDDGERVFDWILLDTPPAQSYFTRLALGAADSVLVPAFAESFAVQGLNQVLDTTRTMHVLTGELDHWRERVLGALVTRWKPSKTAEIAYAGLRTALDAEGIPIFGFNIPLDDKIEQAHQETTGGKVKHIFRLTKNPGPAAQAYDKLAKEVL